MISASALLQAKRMNSTLITLIERNHADFYVGRITGKARRAKLIIASVRSEAEPLDKCAIIRMEPFMGDNIRYAWISKRPNCL